MSLPTLPPLTNGILRIDNTAMDAILKCPTYAWYKQAHRRIPCGFDSDLLFGQALHAAQEFRYKECGSAEITPAIHAKQEALIDSFFSDKQLPDDEWQNAARCKEAIAYWNREFKREPFEVLDTERGVEFELGWVDCPKCKGEGHIDTVFVECNLCAGDAAFKVLYQGKIDAIVRYQGEVMVHDYKKSKYDHDDSTLSKYEVSGQFRGYAWLASQLGYGPIRQYWIDSMICRKPLARATSKAKPRNEFFRDQFRVTDAQIEEWKRDTLLTIETWLRYCAGSQPPPKNRTQCAWPKKCAYFDVCKIDKLDSRLAWLGSSAFKDCEWNPMRKDEK